MQSARTFGNRYICNSIDAGRIVELCHLNKLNKFISLFIDKNHHSKEDNLLLPAMEMAGFPGMGGCLMPFR